MYYESSRLLTYFLKLLPVLLMGVAGQFTWDLIVDLPNTLSSLLFNLAFLTLLLIIFILLMRYVKVVAIGVKSILVYRGRKEIEYSWTDVVAIELDKTLGVYRLDLEDEVVYFLPYNYNGPLLGDMSEMASIIEKYKRELDL